MSLDIEIDVHRIAEVLLADGWHIVASSSFNFTPYKYFEQHGRTPHPVLEGGRYTAESISSTAATWTETDGARVFCPFTSILAVKYLPAP